MIDKAISPLRGRIIEDMTIRKLAPKTQHATCKGSRTSPHSLGDRRTRLVSRTCAAKTGLLNHLVGASNDQRWDCEPK